MITILLSAVLNSDSVYSVQPWFNFFLFRFYFPPSLSSSHNFPQVHFPGLKAWRTFLIIKNLHSLRELVYRPDDGSRGVLYPATKAFSSSPGFSFCFFNFQSEYLFWLDASESISNDQKKKGKGKAGANNLKCLRCLCILVRPTENLFFNSSVQPLFISLLYKRGV